jgi:hypothetical protein
VAAGLAMQLSSQTLIAEAASRQAVPLPNLCV